MSELAKITVARRLMEERIREATIQAVAEFKAAAGITPSSIDVCLVAVARYGQPAEHMVGRVSARIEL